jgi:hypothetical protein
MHSRLGAYLYSQAVQVLGSIAEEDFEPTLIECFQLQIVECFAHFIPWWESS